MVTRISLILGTAVLLALPVAGEAQPQREQDRVLEQRRQGEIMPLRVIERRVVTQMRGADYLGNPIYFERSNSYRFTFMRSGEVIRVEVDARSGRITDRSDR